VDASQRRLLIGGIALSAHGVARATPPLGLIRSDSVGLRENVGVAMRRCQNGLLEDPTVHGGVGQPQGRRLAERGGW